MAIQWRDSLAIGIKEIDDQHKQLFDAIDKLFAACNIGQGKQEVGNTIKFLEDYVVIHFNDEQKLHIKHNYPERVAHKLLHDKFLVDFRELKKRFEDEGASVLFVSNVNRTVVDWLVHHIGNVDKAFAAFVKSQK